MIKFILGLCIWCCFIPDVFAQAEKIRQEIDSLSAILETTPSARAIEDYVRLANKAAYVVPQEVPAMEVLLQKAGADTRFPFTANRLRLIRLVALTNESRYDSATALLDELQKEALMLHDENGLFHYYLNKGMVSKRTGRFEEAVTMYYEALSAADRLNDLRYKLAVYNNLTALFNAMFHYDKAKQSVLEALRISRQNEVEHASGIGSLYANLAIIYKRTGQPDSALYFYKQAKESFEREGSTLVSGIYCNIGILYESAGEFDSAEVYLQKALHMTRLFRQGNYEVNTLNSLADLRIAQKRYAEAIRFAEAAYAKAEKGGALQLQYNSLQGLHNAYALKGDYREAYNTLAQAVRINDSLFSAEKERIAGEVQEKYESDKKDRQIIDAKKEIDTQQKQMLYLAGVCTLFGILAGFILWLYYRTGKLNRKIAVQAQAIEQQNMDLARVNQVKDKLFAIVSHDLRAPVSSLHGLLVLMNNPAVDAGRKQELMNVLQAQLRDTSGMMDTLLQWAKTQLQGWTVRKTPVFPGAVLERLGRQFSDAAAAKGVHLNLHTGFDQEVMADEQLLEIVLYNLVANAIKFTKAPGIIHAEVQAEKEELTVYICDEGEGLSETERMNLLKEDAALDTKVGTDGEKGFGLGLKICAELARQMGASLTVSANNRKGSRFGIRFPIS